MTLPSNSSETVYGIQPLNRYKTKLPSQLSLDVDDWEIGLAEVMYPNSWVNIPETTEIVIGVQHYDRVRSLIRSEKKEGKDPLDLTMLKAKIKKGNFVTNRSLIDVIQLQLDDLSNTINRRSQGNYKKLKLSIIHDRVTGKTKIKGHSGIVIFIPKVLSILMGFGDNGVIIGTADKINAIQNNPAKYFPVKTEPTFITWTLDTLQVSSNFNMDVKRGSHLLYVYSPIVCDQWVGDAQVPLLRVLPVEGEYGQTVTVRNDTIYYLPLSRMNIQEIEIYITDDTGELVSFESGRVIAVLHFRKRV